MVCWFLCANTGRRIICRANRIHIRLSSLYDRIHKFIAKMRMRTSMPASLYKGRLIWIFNSWTQRILLNLFWQKFRCVRSCKLCKIINACENSMSFVYRRLPLKRHFISVNVKTLSYLTYCLEKTSMCLCYDIAVSQSKCSGFYRIRTPVMFSSFFIYPSASKTPHTLSCCTGQIQNRWQYMRAIPKRRKSLPVVSPAFQRHVLHMITF